MSLTGIDSYNIVDRIEDLDSLVNSQNHTLNVVSNRADIASKNFRKHITNANGNTYNDYFSSLSENTSGNDRYTLEWNYNPSGLFSYAQKLNEFVSGSILREDQKISVSQHSYNYHVGSSFAIRMGNSVSITMLGSQKKSSIVSGQTCTLSKGNETSVTTIRGEYDSKREAVDSYSVKDYSDSIYRSSTYQKTYGSFTALATRYYEDSGNARSFEAYGFVLGLDFMPFRGHFTNNQQVICGFYGDYVIYENLFRIFNVVFTAMKWGVASVKEEAYLSKLDACLVKGDDFLIRDTDIASEFTGGGIQKVNSSILLEGPGVRMQNVTHLSG